ncbi:hypothetical protein HK405_000945, partial [Cladochytrium tenue]
MAQLEASADSLPSSEVRMLRGHDGRVNIARFSPAATAVYVATAGADRTIRLWNPLSGLCVKTYTGGHGYEVLDLD